MDILFYKTLMISSIQWIYCFTVDVDGFPKVDSPFLTNGPHGMPPLETQLTIQENPCYTPLPFYIHNKPPTFPPTKQNPNVNALKQNHTKFTAPNYVEQTHPNQTTTPSNRDRLEQTHTLKEISKSTKPIARVSSFQTGVNTTSTPEVIHYTNSHEIGMKSRENFPDLYKGSNLPPLPASRSRVSRVGQYDADSECSENTFYEPDRHLFIKRKQGIRHQLSQRSKQRSNNKAVKGKQKIKKTKVNAVSPNFQAHLAQKRKRSQANYQFTATLPKEATVSKQNIRSPDDRSSRRVSFLDNECRDYLDIRTLERRRQMKPKTLHVLPEASCRNNDLNQNKTEILQRSSESEAQTVGLKYFMDNETAVICLDVKPPKQTVLNVTSTTIDKSAEVTPVKEVVDECHSDYGESKGEESSSESDNSSSSSSEVSDCISESESIQALEGSDDIYTDAESTVTQVAFKYGDKSSSSLDPDRLIITNYERKNKSKTLHRE